MLWTIAVVLIFLWMLGMGSGFEMGLLIHVFYLAAVVLLVVGLSQEVVINRRLRRVSRNHGRKADMEQAV
ncbi:MAG: lmo0937 family membrane protein [Deltaproteobacteria bacterium]|nr:lmo0937 family membrane protein [Deltaproteobacteria bacterium]